MKRGLWLALLVGLAVLLARSASPLGREDTGQVRQGPSFPFDPALRLGWSGGLRVRNHLFRKARVEVRLKYSTEVTCDRPALTFEISEKRQAIAPFRMRRRPGAKAGRVVVTADLTVNGSHIGEYAEALVDLQ